MSIITLTSDFGTTDHRIAAIKGKILSLNKDATLVDITHDIHAYNLGQTAYIVGNCYHHFPAGSVHIISVDSFFRKDRKCILYKADAHYFLAADNGVLSLIFHDIKPEEIYEITFSNRFDDEVTFTSLDIFAPAAVHLISGGLPEVIGRKIKTAKQLSFPKPGTTDNIIIGEVMYIDNFGNVVTNISRKLLNEQMKGYERFEIKFRSTTITKIFERYTDVVSDWKRENEFHGHKAAIFNESGMLELTIYKGNKHNGARTLFGLNFGDSIMIEMFKE